MKYTIGYILLLFALATRAQPFKVLPEPMLHQIIEKQIELSEASVDFTDLQEQLEYMASHKIKISLDEIASLQKLFFISSSDRNKIAQHLKVFGDFLSIYELQAIDGLSEEALQWLPYFVWVEPNDFTQVNNGNFTKGSRTILLFDTDLQKRKGYLQNSSQPYLGNAHRYLVRHKTALSKSVEFGFTAEKDAGEAFSFSNYYGFEFYSAYVHYKENKLINQVIIGDYQINIGQGLALGNGIASRKSALVLNVNRNYEILRPYRSTNQFGFLRGVAIKIKKGSFEFLPFLSYKNLSTSLLLDTNFSPVAYTSEIISGMFRTETELLKRNNNAQFLGGMHIQKQFKQQTFGITYIHQQLQLPVSKSSKAYELYQFTGDHSSNLSLNANGLIKNLSYFTEFAWSINQNAGALNTGILLPMAKNADLLLLYRNYHKAYYSAYVNAFGEFSGTQNESGIYAGITIKPLRKLSIQSYADFFSAPWLRYRVNMPSVGSDFLTDWTYSFSKNTHLIIRYRQENKQLSAVLNNENLLQTNKRESIRIQVQTLVQQRHNFTMRFERSFYSNQLTSNGNLFFIDHGLNLFKNTSLRARYTWFEIDDFNARVYAVEPDVLYQYSLPMFQNSGYRYLILVQTKLTKKIGLWVKWSQVTYENRNIIGSGNEQISGNTLQEIRLQMMINL